MTSATAGQRQSGKDAAGLEQDPLRRVDGGALAGGGCLMVGYAE